MISRSLAFAETTHPSTTRVESDLHADTCAFRDNCCVLHTYRNGINVTPFHQKLGLLPNVSEALIALAYDCPLQFVTFILLYDHSLFIPGMNVHLTTVSP
jgi:hypothetical protein